MDNTINNKFFDATPKTVLVLGGNGGIGFAIRDMKFKLTQIASYIIHQEIIMIAIHFTLMVQVILLGRIYVINLMNITLNST